MEDIARSDIRIKKKKMTDTVKSQMEESAINQLDAALRHERWLAVVFFVEDGRLFCQDTTYNFPVGDFDESVKLLRLALDQKLGKEPPPPLPLANHLLSGAIPAIVFQGKGSVQQKVDTGNEKQIEDPEMSV